MRYAAALGIAYALVISGCAGGPSSTPSPFVKFSSLTVPGSVRLTGQTQESTYAFNTGASTVTSSTAATSAGANATLDLTLDASRAVTGAKVSSALGTTATASAMTTVGNWTSGSSPDTRTRIQTAAVSVLGWDYQTFGVWVTGYGTSSGTLGAFSGGSTTDRNAIPTTGSATYSGTAGGVYVIAGQDVMLTQATMSAAVNYATRAIAFSTSGTTATALNSGTSTSMSALNLSGTLNYSAGTNQFSGTVGTTGGGSGNAAMSGTASGQFFGLIAEEIGGTFSVTDGTGRMVGAFGGKK